MVKTSQESNVEEEGATPTARRSRRARKKNTKWEQDDKIGQKPNKTSGRRGKGGGRKKKKKVETDEDNDASEAAEDTEEEKPKKKRKYTRRKKTSVIPRVTTTSSTGRIRKPSTKYVMGSSMYTSTVAHTQTTHTQVQGRDRGWCGHGEFR